MTAEAYKAFLARKAKVEAAADRRAGAREALTKLVEERARCRHRSRMSFCKDTGAVVSDKLRSPW